jgi:hypothetical protein
MTTLPFMPPRCFPQWLGTLLLWLTLLALPGLAAAAAQPCALHGHGAAAAAATAPAMRMPMQKPMPMPPAETNVQRAAPPGACHDGTALHANAGSATQGAHQHARCSACAACCAGVAPAPAVTPALGAPGAAYVAVPFRPSHLSSVDTLPLERPPRSAFAFA